MRFCISLLFCFAILVANSSQVETDEKQDPRDALKQLCELESEEVSKSKYGSTLLGVGIGLAALPGLPLPAKIKVQCSSVLTHTRLFEGLPKPQTFFLFSSQHHLQLNAILTHPVLTHNFSGKGASKVFEKVPF